MSWVLAADQSLVSELCADTAAARQIEIVRDLLACSLRAEASNRPLCDSIQSVIDYFSFSIGRGSSECAVALFLDSRNCIIGELRIDGGPDSVPLSPRAVVLRALLVGAAGVVLAHNHPSGDVSPSRSDIDVTHALAIALQAVDVRLLDHLVLAAGAWTSMRERGIL